MRAGFWLCLFLTAALPAARAANAPVPDSKPAIAPPSDWVTPLKFELRSQGAPIDPTDDERWLLVNRQVNAAENETYTHCVRQVLTMSGVQNGSTVSLEYNPSFQSLTLHWLRIWRGTNSVSRLDADQIRSVQPEHDLGEGVVNGRASAIIVLNDVRAGDIIDYAWSVRGANPVLSGRFWDAVAVQLGEPVERIVTRVVWPKGRTLYAQNHGCAVTPAVLRGTNQMEYVWDLRGVPALRPEDRVPVWQEQLPWVQLTEFQTWAQVNQWAMELFRNTEPPTPALMQTLAEWRRLPDLEQQVLAVLQFVQEDVRYFGIEIGASAEKPAAPSVVFGRRFGDCKDKTLLFVTALRALGIGAWPVLVNSTARHTLDSWRPSAAAFDHAIALVELGGRAYWVDPTANYQRGPLSAHYLPAYERGLVVDPKTTGLSVIPPTTAPPETRTTEYFQLRDVNDSADLKVVTVASGGDAERLRAMFATTPRAEIERSYLHYYASFYPGARQVQPIDFADDAQRNRAQVTEYYAIDRIWTRPDRNSPFHCEFYPAQIRSFLSQPVHTDRVMPLAVTYPAHETCRTEVLLPRIWLPDARNASVLDPAFMFRMNMQCGGTRLVMEYELQTTADSVPAARVPDYLQKLNRAAQSLGYSISW